MTHILLNSLDEPKTAVFKLSKAAYPQRKPFHPSASYPEYHGVCSTEMNLVYDGVREMLRMLGMDATHYGTPQWNPLGELIQPGNRVVMKPNYLFQSHKNRPDEWEQVITHGSVIRAVLDYVLLALQGRGEVWVMDGPQFDADWDAILARTGIGDVIRYCSSVSPVPIRLLDLRPEWQIASGGVIYDRKVLPGDPNGTTTVDLGDASEFVGHLGAGHYYGADYDTAEVNYHHTQGRHEYRLSRTALSADVFINLPKMKTHKKVGVTLCLKNLVGINIGRNWLPHHTDGDPTTGGDQFPVHAFSGQLERSGVRWFQKQTLRYSRFFAPIYRLAKIIAEPLFGNTEEVVRSGNWAGNDTAWRMVLDINKALFYSDGSHFPMPVAKRYFAVVDGVVAGEGNGPAAPDAISSGILVAGFNPVAVDCLAARLMGLDPMRIAQLRMAFQARGHELTRFAYKDIQVESNWASWRMNLVNIEDRDCFHFRPHFGWIGAIESQSGAAPVQDSENPA